jgi:hypothetical protein
MSNIIGVKGLYAPEEAQLKCSEFEAIYNISKEYNRTKTEKQISKRVILLL